MTFLIRLAWRIYVQYNIHCRSFVYLYHRRTKFLSKMASEEHKSLTVFIKDVHLSLRKSAIKIGADQAWSEHCKNKDVLRKYAEYMQTLATKHWEENAANEKSEAFSRIKWVVDFCQYYFIEKNYILYREKETAIADKINISLNSAEITFSEPLNLIDIGSCYNPFKHHDIFQVVAIDLCPANDSVLESDFLKVSLGSAMIKDDKKVTQLQINWYEVVTFCFLLEYIPSSELRISACEKAYKLLKPGGLLLISTPDSKHVGANSNLMKCWRYTLACIGFSRIRYEKHKHMHCMAFRKAVVKETAVRWASINNDKGLQYAIHIPQDFTIDKTSKEPPSKKRKI